MTVGLLSIANPSVQAGGGLQIILSRNASWASAPAYYETDLVWAANQLMAACPNTNITVTITCGYTEIAGIPSSVPPSSSVAGIRAQSNTIPYTSIKTYMNAMSNKHADFSAMLANLPAGATNGITTPFRVGWPACKALGIFSPTVTNAPTGPNDTSQADSDMGIGTGWSSAKTKGVFLHELSHALGRIAGEMPFVFSRFTAAGAWDTSSSGASLAYFSLDGGTTNLAWFAPSSDLGDFRDDVTDPGSGGLTDSFDASQTNPAEYLTPLDFRQLRAMGFY